MALHASKGQVKGTIEATIKANFPKVKEVQYFVDGVQITEWDA